MLRTTTHNMAGLRAAVSTLALLAMSACASIEQYAADFEARWPVTAETLGTARSEKSAPEAVATAALSDTQTDSLAVRKAKLEKLTPGSSCRAIYDLAPSVLNDDKSNTDARLKLAACDYETRDLASARARYRELMKADADPRALKGLGLTELRDGRYDTALDLLKSYNSKTGQSDWQAMNALGFAEDQLGNTLEAEAAYLAAATLSPGHGAPMNNLGMMYMRVARYDDAIRSFSLALNRQPDLDIAGLNRRIAYGLKGETGKALSGASEKERSAVYNSLGADALSRGDRQTAQKMFRKALDSSPVFYENAYANLERAAPPKLN